VFKIGTKIGIYSFLERNQVHYVISCCNTIIRSMGDNSQSTTNMIGRFSIYFFL